VAVAENSLLAGSAGALDENSRGQIKGEAGPREAVFVDNVRT
jgi:hypothetical protein